MLAIVSAGLALAIACAPAAAALPRPAHVVVVVEENHTFAQIVGNAKAPYLNRLAATGALFTHAFGVTHPSLPNYFALFSGLTNDNGDGCPATGIPADAPNLGSELLSAKLTFHAYSESLPEAGWHGCAAGTYGRKHAPWVHFSNVPAALHRPLSQLHSYDALGTVTFLIPNVDDDMHDGTVMQGDDWFSARLDSLVRWARTHDTLVIVTWDEGYDDTNTVPTFFVGPMVRPGRYAERVDHYTVLRTIEQMYGLAPTGHAASARALTDIWR